MPPPQSGPPQPFITLTVVDSLERNLTLMRERIPYGVLRETEAPEEDM